MHAVCLLMPPSMISGSQGYEHYRNGCIHVMTTLDLMWSCSYICGSYQSLEVPWITYSCWIAGVPVNGPSIWFCPSPPCSVPRLVTKIISSQIIVVIQVPMSTVQLFSMHVPLNDSTNDHLCQSLSFFVVAQSMKTTSCSYYYSSLGFFSRAILSFHVYFMFILLTCIT